MFSKYATYAKAIVGALIAAGNAVAFGLSDGELTQVEITLAIVAALTVFGGVYGVTNKPTDSQLLELQNEIDKATIRNI